MARWLLKEPELPRKVISIGGRFGFSDAGDVPNTQITYYDFPSAPVLYEVHNCVPPRGLKRCRHFADARPTPVPTASKVMLSSDRARCMTTRESRSRNLMVARITSRTSSAPSAAAARKSLTADIQEGHRSTVVTHLGNISYRVGQPAAQGEIRERIAGVPLLEEMFDRLVTHLQGPGDRCRQAHDHAGPMARCRFRERVRPAPRSGQCLGARDLPRRVPAAGRRVIVGRDRSDSTEGELHESPPV